jgi:hypothetical protein
MWKAIITLLAAIAFCLDGFFGSDFGGFDPNRFPIPQDNPPLQPIGFAFAIWFPIYLWLIASGIYGVARRPNDPGWDRFRGPLIVSLLIGTPWIQVAQVSPFWSTIMIWAMLIFALLALYRAPENDAMWARGPIGLYAGWLTAASGVGTSVLLSGNGVLPSMTSAVLLLVIVLALAVKNILTLAHSSLTYVVAFQWALIGVMINSLDSQNTTMLVLAGIGSFVVALARRYQQRDTE